MSAAPDPSTACRCVCSRPDADPHVAPSRPHLTRALRAFLRHPSALRLLAEHGLDCGWNDGGCRILADALVQWLGVPARHGAIASDYSPVAHVLVRWGPYALDADGLSPERALVRRWRDLELVPGARLVDPTPGELAGATEIPATPD
jgi:hypothetical protein